MTPWLALPLAVSLAAGWLILSTVRLGISPLPSAPAVRRLMLRLLDRLLEEQAGTGDIVDLGSGWGGLARRAALALPGRQVVGLEASFLPWAFSSTMARLAGPANLSFRRLDFLKAPIPAADAYLCYLSPRTMESLAPGLLPHLQAGGVMISAVFALRACRPDQVYQAADLYRSPVYVYGDPSAGRLRC